MNSASEQITRYCAGGDNAAFAAFYRAQAPKLWKFLVARGCAPEAAYDVLAEAFFRFAQSICRDPRAPVALLYRIAINLRIDAYRRERASAAVTAATPEMLDVPAPEEPDDHAHVRALVHRLPPGEQNLLLLRYWIGLSHKEVAQALDMPEGTVRRQCAAVLRKIREHWEEGSDKYAAG